MMNTEERGTVLGLSRKDLRRQKLMEYLAAKGKTNPKFSDKCQIKKPATCGPQVAKGKENKVSGTVCLTYRDKNVECCPAQSTPHASGRVLGTTFKTNVRGHVLAGEDVSKHPPGPCGPAEGNIKQNTALSRTYTIASLKAKQSAAVHPMKQRDTRTQSLGKSFSNTVHSVTTEQSTRSRCTTNASKPGPRKSISLRLSFGPLVKTKTGLIPAVIQPRNTQSNVRSTAPPANTATASLSARVRSSTFSSASASQRSDTQYRKSFSSTLTNKPACEIMPAASTARAGIKVEDSKKYNCKSATDKLPQSICKSYLPTKLKQRSVSSKCTVASIKPAGTVTVTKMANSAAQRTLNQPKNKSTQQISDSLKASKLPPCKVNSRPPSGPTNCSSRAVRGVTLPASLEVGARANRLKKTDVKKVHSSTNVQVKHTCTQKAGALATSQRAPQVTKTNSQAVQATDKMSKASVKVIAQTEQKKPTTAQEERMRKLQEWREAKGISYKRPPMSLKPGVRHTVSLPHPFWAKMTEEDEAHSLISAVDRSLSDCITLLSEGCPPDQVKEVLSRLPTVSQKFAKYWVCQARLMEQQENLDVLPMFEEAIRVVLEPVDELRTVVFEILKKKDEHQGTLLTCENEKEQILETVENTPQSSNAPVTTPNPVGALICGETGDSSVVKFKITATPGGPRSQQKNQAQVSRQEVRFFTPVRRSVRIERASLRYPASLQEHDVCVASYHDLISEENKSEETAESSSTGRDTQMYIYRENEALKDKVAVQLVYDTD
ncbi:cytoskeleton-associated protein 2-like [Thalassophryne amazonica]|uniref:cytoskeleton-associated protein 2-like n=1 Tax=Thalassophryne amazonica TaxID=390379 RepID=UPI001470D127|nr:cytoskeleton-associated protein 2-like [Thalassophryne amazonica]